MSGGHIISLVSALDQTSGACIKGEPFSSPSLPHGVVLRKLLPRKRDRMIVLPAIGSQLIATTSLFLMPVLISTLQLKAGMPQGVAGLLLSMELVASAFTTILITACFRGNSPRGWALFGGFLAIAGTGLTLVSPSPPMLFSTRLVAGIGAGIVGAQATRVLSRGIERDKLISIVTIASILNAAIWLAVLPYLIDRIGYRAPYLCLLLIALVGAYLLRRLPSLPDRPGSGECAAQSQFSSAAVFTVVAIFLTQLGQGAFWTLEEAFGSRAGFSDHAIGVLLSAVTLLLLLGGVASAWITNRLGRFSSLFLLVAINAISILLISTITVHWIFIAANVLQSVTNLSSVICQLGLAASIDRTGRVVAASTSLVMLGNGLGPSVSAYLSGALGASYIGIVVLALNVLALTLYCAVRLRDAREMLVPVS
jgi:predicted MFS family arabinose efflux permease